MQVTRGGCEGGDKGVLKVGEERREEKRREEKRREKREEKKDKRCHNHITTVRREI